MLYLCFARAGDAENEGQGHLYSLVQHVIPTRESDERQSISFDIFPHTFHMLVLHTVLLHHVTKEVFFPDDIWCYRVCRVTVFEPPGESVDDDLFAGVPSTTQAPVGHRSEGLLKAINVYPNLAWLACICMSTEKVFAADAEEAAIARRRQDGTDD